MKIVFASIASISGSFPTSPALSTVLLVQLEPALIDFQKRRSLEPDLAATKMVYSSIASMVRSLPVIPVALILEVLQELPPLVEARKYMRLVAHLTT